MNEINDTLQHYKETFGLEIENNSMGDRPLFSVQYPQPFDYFDICWSLAKKHFYLCVKNNTLYDDIEEFDAEYNKLRAILSKLNYCIENN